MKLKTLYLASAFLVTSGLLIAATVKVSGSVTLNQNNMPVETVTWSLKGSFPTVKLKIGTVENSITFDSYSLGNGATKYEFSGSACGYEVTIDITDYPGSSDEGTIEIRSDSSPNSPSGGENFRTTIH